MTIEDWFDREMPLNIVCVLKRGGIYDFNYVKILSQGVRRHLTRRHRFVCLTDADPLHRDWFRAHRINYRPLYHGWSGAWSKIELFRPGFLTGRILYLDLATIVTDSLDALADYRGRFAMLGDPREPGRFVSSLMMWTAGDLDFIYHGFAADPFSATDALPDDRAWMDIVCRSKGIVPDRVQDLAPGLCMDIIPILDGAPLRAKPPGAGLVSFRGRPRPHELTELSEFVRENWV